MLPYAEDGQPIQFVYSEEKNTKLYSTYGIGFEQIIQLIREGNVVRVFKHPNAQRYPNQQCYAVNVNGYIYIVPFVLEGNRHFLKTFFPSRKATRDALKGKPHGT